MFKVCGGILVLLSTSLYGLINGNELKRQLKDLQEIRKIMMIFKSKIEHLNMPIDEIFYNISKEINSPYKDTFDEMYQKICNECYREKYSINEIWEDSINGLCKKIMLNSRQKEEFIRFGENLNVGNSKVLLGVIEIYEESLIKETKELSDSIKEKIKVYGWLGVVAGAFVTIILI